MAEQDNIRVVQQVFEAFRRGDFPGLLDLMADDVEWRLGGPTEAFRAGTRRGKDTLQSFFRQLGEASEFEQFEPHEFIAQAERVVVLGHERQRIRATGRVTDVDWAMVFTVRGGKVVQFRNYEDTAADAAAREGA